MKMNTQGAGRRSFAAAASLTVAMVLWGVASAARGDSEPVVLTPFSEARGLEPPAPWHFASLPNKAPTRFEVVQQGPRRVLRIEADDSYGNLVHRVRVALNTATTLSWRWRVDRLVQDADLRTRAGDDAAAKVCVFFDFPVERLPMTERLRLGLVRKTTGEDVPSEALCYVWDNKEPKGTVLVNAFTRRMQMVVLESGPPATTGTWVSERRGLLADYQRAFGGEAGSTMPDVVAVVISADADNTHGHGLAYLTDLALNAAP
ncbi:MAG: DUF3047 domain-containing protein [Variovorax sp.]